MGYNTRYGLSHDDYVSDIDHAEGVRMASGYTYLFDGERVKWYDHEEHMARYSKRYPNVVFVLDGEGEESGDIWRKWFKGGQIQRWKLEVSMPASPPEDWA